MEAAAEVVEVAGAEEMAAAREARNRALQCACARGDWDATRALLADDGVDVWYEDPACLGWSALHFAAEHGDPRIVDLLLQHGAPWNIVDALGYTPAQIAHSLNNHSAYHILLDHAVRQTFLLNALQSYPDDDIHDETHGKTDDALGDAADDALGDAADDARDDEADGQARAIVSATGRHIVLKPAAADVANSTARFLRTSLRFEKDALGQTRCLDVDNNMVMAEWETDIMACSADLLCTGQPQPFAVLNIGFGLGIVDRLLQRHRPHRHVIIEPHPDALAYARALGFHQLPGVELLPGRWEDWINPLQDPAKMAQLGCFDAVYWDTYSQDYNDLRSFFHSLPTLLRPNGRFSFFHGLAATNPFLYQVYTRIAELDLHHIGLDTTWHPLRPSIREQEWLGVKHKYWQLDTYYCPLARLRPS
jgi:protein arginine N-methyltransferase 2